MHKFREIQQELVVLINDWEPVLLSLSETQLNENRNSQNRTIKQILGHMIDSASNNTHRVVHLQYQNSPLHFPDYANHGNNDRWIGIQNYQAENWENMVQLWKYIHLHFLHVIANISTDKLENVWISGLNKEVSLEAMVNDFPGHFNLHLSEIKDLMNH